MQSTDCGCFSSSTGSFICIYSSRRVWRDSLGWNAWPWLSVSRWHVCHQSLHWGKATWALFLMLNVFTYKLVTNYTGQNEPQPKLWHRFYDSLELYWRDKLSLEVLMCADSTQSKICWDSMSVKGVVSLIKIYIIFILIRLFSDICS